MSNDPFLGKRFVLFNQPVGAVQRVLWERWKNNADQIPISGPSRRTF